MSTKINSIHTLLSTSIVDNSRPLIRTAYDGLAPIVSDLTATQINLEDDEKPFFDPSMTKQSFADECDINQIMERFALTGEITHVNKIQPRFGDWSIVPEYQSALNLVIEAGEAFADLPAKIRDRFHNNAEAYLRFVSNPDNAEEMYRLGIADRPEGSPDGDTPPAEPSNGPPEGAPAPSSTTS